MRRRSPLARLCALAAMAALAFTQVAMAAFSCPVGTLPVAHAAMEMAAGEECPEAANPGSHHLCIKTCQDEPQKAEIPSLDALPPSTDGGLRIEMPSPVQRGGFVAIDATLERATSPPPIVLFARYLK